MRWVVAATGPSLTEEVASKCRDQNVIAVNDAYRRFPDARILYAADAQWWDVHKGVPDFPGEKWIPVNDDCHRLNMPAAQRYKLRLIDCRRRDPGFSFEQGRIHSGGNSGYQAVNLAILRGAKTIVLVGFDMQGTHFFGDHPPMPRRGPNDGKGFQRWIKHFSRAAELLPQGIRIFNATPDSALTCFPMLPLEEALRA